MFNYLNIIYNILIIMAEQNSPETNKNEFYKIIREFVPDLLTTFPEYKEVLTQGIIDILQENTTTDDSHAVYDHCLSVYPPRFFDILYQNEEMFSNSEHDHLYFLPNIDFKKIWQEDISEKTKEVLFKYLQLVLFSVVSDVKSENSFGDTAKLFEAINEDELKNKLEKTLNDMQGLFEEQANAGDDISNINLNNLPNPDSIHDHLNGMLGGKLGKLAREIAEETADELDVNMDDATSVNDVFQKLFRNPGKLMNMVKGIGNKIETKIKSGELNESELMKEAGEMMTKMNNMPGMGNIKSMLKKFGLPMGKGSGVNMGAFQNQMAKNMRLAQARERMKARSARKKQNTVVQTMTEEERLERERIAQEIQDKLISEEVYKSARVKKNKKRRKKKDGKKMKSKKSSVSHEINS